jgi:hypothetical protein
MCPWMYLFQDRQDSLERLTSSTAGACTPGEGWVGATLAKSKMLQGVGHGEGVGVSGRKAVSLAGRASFLHGKGKRAAALAGLAGFGCRRLAPSAAASAGASAGGASWRRT